MGGTVFLCYAGSTKITFYSRLGRYQHGTSLNDYKIAEPRCQNENFYRTENLKMFHRWPITRVGLVSETAAY